MAPIKTTEQEVEQAVTAGRFAYIATLEADNARLSQSLTFALERKQLFADEFLEASNKLRLAQERILKIEQLSLDAIKMIKDSLCHVEPLR